MPSWIAGPVRLCGTVAVVRQKGVEENDRAYGGRYFFSDAGNDETAVGVPAQHDVGQPLPFHHIDDVGDVGGDIDLRTEKMRAFAESGKRRREDLVAAAAKPIGNAWPAPTAMPSAMNQDERMGHEPSP